MDSPAQTQKKRGVLLVDDEVLALKYFSKTFQDRFSVYVAPSVKDALLFLENAREEIGVIVTDQRMPESSGVELLEVIRDRYPRTVRVLTTAYSEIDTLVAAINAGAVFAFVSKPWDLGELEATISRALQYYDHQTEQEAAAQLSGLQKKLLEDEAYNIGLIAAKIGHYVHNALCPLTYLVDELIRRYTPSPSCSLEFLENIRTHIEEVTCTLKDLELASVPQDPQSCEMLDMDALLDQAILRTTVLRNQRQLQVEKAFSGALPRIWGNAGHLEKLFRFMIAEESVSLPAGSTVRVRCQSHQADGAVLGVNIVFEDFVPVSPQLQPASLLHPFNLRGSNPREFGVFLVCCYFIAVNHGGSLSVRAKKDAGLEFSFFFPEIPHGPAALNQQILDGLSFSG